LWLKKDFIISINYSNFEIAQKCIEKDFFHGDVAKLDFFEPESEKPFNHFFELEDPTHVNNSIYFIVLKNAKIDKHTTEAISGILSDIMCDFFENATDMEAIKTMNAFLIRVQHD